MPATLTGTVFHDLQHDGQFTSGDPGIPGVNVILYTAPGSSSGTPGCIETTTGADGRYSFSIAEAGTYTVYETVQVSSACPPSVMEQPAGYSYSNGPRKAAVTVTQQQVTGNQTVNGPDFSHDTLNSPLPCDAEMYLFEGRPTNRLGINLVTGAQTDYGPLNQGGAVNAIGYYVLDNHIYGYDQTANTLVRVGQDAQDMLLYPRPAGMPAAAYSVGAMDLAGFYYVFAPGTGRFYTVDLRQDSPTFLKLVDPSNGYVEQTGNYGTPLSSPLTIGDWAFNPRDNRLYGVERSGVVYRVDETTGNVTPLDTTGPNPGETFGSVVIDGNGNLYAVNNADGTIYRYIINGDSASGTRFASTQVDAFNDAAMCPYAVIELDFGDAPDAGGGGGAGNYNTLLASNGPRHGVGARLYLGTTVTAEEDAHQNASANGDDLTQGIQDDGLSVPLPILSVNAASYTLNVTVTNYTGSAANLYGWVDFNKNGLFEASEAAAAATVPAGSGTGQYTLVFNRPAGTVLTPDHTFVRLRVTSDNLTDTGQEVQDTRSVGPASDGEVEDYILQIGTTADLSLTKSADLPVLHTGDTIQYTVTITNNSSEEALNVVLEDIVPPEITGVMYRIDGSPLDYWPGSLPLGTLTPGQVVIATLQGVFDGTTLGPVVNTATVTASSDDPNPGNNTDTVTTPVERSANLVIQKSPQAASSTIGETFEFLISVTNNGPDPAENTDITDIVESDFTSPEYSLNSGADWLPWTGQLPAGTLEAGDIFSFLLRGTVESGSSNTLTNTASVTSNTDDPDPTDNTVTVQVPKNASADLSVAKSGEPDPAGLGQQLSYTIVVSNSGPSPADNITINDALPLQLLNAEYSLDRVSWSPWTGTLAAGSLEAGSVYTVYLRGTIDPSAASGPLSNTVTVNSSTPDPDPSNNTYTETVTIEDTANLTITKTASPVPVTSGETLTYTIAVTNKGPSAASNVTVTDPLHAGILNPEYSVDGSSYTPWNGQYTVSALAAGAVTTITIRGTVSVSQAESLVNTAVVTSDTLDPNPDDNSATTVTPAALSADLEITKTGPAVAEAGGPVTYTITVTNNGPSDAQDVSVTDAVPAAVAGTEYSVNGSAYSPWTGSYTIPVLAASGSVTISIRGTLSPSASGSLTNSAFVSSSTPDPDLSNNDDSVITNVTASADLSVVKTASPDPAVPGQTLTYTVTIGNAGPSAASDVSLADSLPAALTGGEYSLDGTTWNPWSSPYAAGTIQPGSITTIYLRGTVASSAGASVTNTATVSSSTPDPDASNNTWTIATPVSLSADMSVTKTASPDPAVPGNLLTYTITASNAGPADSQNVKITDTAPSLLSNVTYSTDNGTNWTTWPGTLDLGTVTAGNDVTILLRGTVSGAATGTIRNTALVSSDTSDPDPSNNTDTVLTPVNTSADISVTKTASPTTAAAGQLLTYTVTVSNTGPNTAEAVALTDAVSPDLTQVEFSTDGGTNWNPWTSPYNIGNLDSGTNRTVLIRGTLNAAATGLLVNEVSVSSVTPDPDPDNNTFTLRTPIGTSADISVTKTASPNPAVPGALLSYTVTVRNAGPDAAADVVLTDTAASALGNPEYSLNGGAYTAWTGSLTIGSLAASGTASVIIRGTVGAGDEGQLTNQASVTTATPDPYPDNNTVTIETPLAPSANLSIQKTGTPNPAVPGELLTYTLTVRNAGPSLAKEITVIDTVPGILSDAEYVVDGSSSWAPWTGTHQTASLAPGAVTTLTIRGTLDPSAAGTIRNTAVVTAATPDPDPTDNLSVDERPAAPSADVSIRKTASPNPAVPGSYVIYTLTASNAGPADAQNITLTDTMPARLTNQEYSTDGGKTWNTWNGNFNSASLPAGSTLTVMLRGLLPASDTGGVSLTNTAVIESNTPDPNPDNNTSTNVTPVSALADLAVRKTSQQPVVSPGEQIIYRITVSNAGPDASENVIIRDTEVTGQLTDVQYSADDGKTWNIWNGSYNAGILQPNSTLPDFLLRGTVPESATVITNTASVSSDTPDPDTSNNTSSLNIRAENMANLSITKSASPSPAVPGQKITYTLTLTNNGPGTARRVTLVDAVPSQISGTEFSIDGGATWTPWKSPYEIGSMNAGSTTVVLIRGTLSVSASGTVINTAVVSSSTPDPVPGDNTATDTTPVQDAADVSVIKLAHPTPAVPGQYLTYTLFVANAGPADAHDVLLTDLTRNAEYSLDGGVHWQPWYGSYKLGTISGGASARLLIRTLLPSDTSGSIENTASVSSSTPDPNPDNNTDTINTPVAVTADLSVQKTSETAVASPGDTVTYQIVVRNLGTIQAENVRLRDDIPNGLSNLEYSTNGGANWSAWISPYQLGNLENQGTRTILLRGTVTASAGIIANTVYVNSDTPDPDYTNNRSQANVTVTVPDAADLSITKTACSDTVCPCRPAAFHITVTNNGPGTAKNVIVSDPLPSELLHGRYSLNNGFSWHPWSGQLAAGDLVSGASFTILLAANVDRCACGLITNKAMVSASTPDPNPDNNRSSATVRICR
ncbi:DUF11 domain-containing protein [Lacrimispora sp. NSJ-141]|uniref:DUF11 domain-containing protein n=1 Tax=Lientehia hominis TaxID=2897778 RepID=A0AAP2RG34_9FIRM|nr:GEVED domain-containing protein [Lientehia hominis]MCD2491567.1 DUF11 domain-containing protein [Lientehia hominis]